MIAQMSIEPLKALIVHLTPGSEVLVSTALLENFRTHHVTWIVAGENAPLLRGMAWIDRLVCAESPNQLSAACADDFEVIVNLQAEPIWSEWAKDLRAEHRYGIAAVDSDGGNVHYHKKSASAPPWRSAQWRHRPLLQNYFELIGSVWCGQRPRLGCQPIQRELFDVGLAAIDDSNMPMRQWRKIRQRLQREYSISHLYSGTPVSSVADWIARCGLVVASNELVLTMAVALEKPVVALLRPSGSERHYLFGRGAKLTSVASHDCSLCREPDSVGYHTCNQQFELEEVAATVMKLLPPRRVAAKAG